MPALAPLPWQDALWRRLSGLRAQERLPHGVLISGAHGVGKGVFAEALAALLFCQSPVSGAACGRCKGCALWRAESHPDFFRLSPEVDAKSGKVARVIKVDQARALTEFLGKSAQMGGWRVAVIEPADTLNTASANSLLKTLEEPGARTLLLLLTDQPLALLPTLRSRCQHFVVTPPEAAVARAWLAPRLSDPGAASLLLSLCRDAPLAAEQLAVTEGFRKRAELARALRDVRAGKAGPLSAASAFQKLPPEELFRTLHALVSDIILVRLARENRVANTDVLPVLRELASLFELPRLLALQAACLENQRLVPANIQPGLLADRFWQSLRG